MHLNLQVLAGSSRAEAMSIWRQLEVDLQSPRLTCSSIWTDTWLNHFGNQIPHQFIVGYRRLALRVAFASSLTGSRNETGRCRFEPGISAQREKR